jgi:hypothetical protein
LLDTGNTSQVKPLVPIFHGTQRDGRKSHGETHPGFWKGASHHLPFSSKESTYAF